MPFPASKSAYRSDKMPGADFANAMRARMYKELREAEIDLKVIRRKLKSKL